MTLRNGDAWEGSPGGRKAWASHQDLLGPLRLGQRARRVHNRLSTAELGMRLGIGFGGEEGE